MDKLLIDLYVEEYADRIEGFIPDLCGFTPSKEDRDSIEDFAADYIFDREKPKRHIPEIREAATKIADLYV